MFSWLKKWFWPDNVENTLYHPAERNIYTFFDGQKVVRADPLRLYKALMDKGPDIDIDRKVAASQSKDATKAHSSLVKNIAAVFNVKSLEEGGLTDEEVVNLLDHFLTFLEHQKKSSVTPSIISNKSSASVVSSAEIPTTPNSLASPSTKKEVFTVRPMPSASGSPSPLAPSTQE